MFKKKKKNLKRSDQPKWWLVTNLWIKLDGASQNFVRFNSVAHKIRMNVKFGQRQHLTQGGGKGLDPL